MSVKLSESSSVKARFARNARMNYGRKKGAVGGQWKEKIVRNFLRLSPFVPIFQNTNCHFVRPEQYFTPPSDQSIKLRFNHKFQFSPSVNRVFRIIGVILASYSLTWEKGQGKLGSLINTGRFFLSPEQRASRIIKVGSKNFIRTVDV